MNDEQFTGVPTDHLKINVWMRANGWTWHVSDRLGFDGYWEKPNTDTVSQSLAAEFYKMAHDDDGKK